MLGKLTKHELIASGRMLIPMYIALICASVVGKIFIWLSSKEAFIDSVPFTFYKIVSGISSLVTILYIVMIVVVLIATILFILIRFYKNYYTDEGYLMLTLPVSSKSLILSKLFAALIWTVVSIAVVLGTIALIINSDETQHSFKLICEEFMNLLERMAPEMNLSVGWLITEGILVILIAIISKYLMFYTSIAAGPSFSNKNKVVGSIIAYVVITILSQIVSLIMMYVLSNVMPNYIDSLGQNAGQAVQSTVLATGIINLIFCVVFFFVTDHLMKTKTNLE